MAHCPRNSTGWGGLTTMQQYGRVLIWQRKLLNGYLYQGKVKDYLSNQLFAARAVLPALLDEKSDPAETIMRYVALFRCLHMSEVFASLMII